MPISQIKIIYFIRGRDKVKRDRTWGETNRLKQDGFSV